MAYCSVRKGVCVCAQRAVHSACQLDHLSRSHAPEITRQFCRADQELDQAVQPQTTSCCVAHPAWCWQAVHLAGEKRQGLGRQGHCPSLESRAAGRSKVWITRSTASRLLPLLAGTQPDHLPEVCEQMG